MRRRAVAGRLAGMALTFAALGAGFGACGGDPTGLDSSGEPQLVGGVSARTLDPALVGRWSRIVIVSDATIGLNATETRWTFFADGRAERRLVTSNLALGLADQVVTLGSWSTGRDGTVTIVLDGVGATTLRFAYRVTPSADGARLELADQIYQLLPS